MSNPIISITSADSVTVFVGGKPFTVASDNARYDELKAAITAADYDLVDQIVNASLRLTEVLGVYGDVQVFQGHVTFQGRRVGNYLVNKMLQMANRGRDPEPYARFLDRVMRNPTQQAIDQLYQWLEKAKLPVLPDGRFLAYRRVRDDYRDVHTGRMDNTPGVIVSMPREQCDLNKDNTCSHGLHFCNHRYLRSFSGERVLIMAEDPAFVVSFPEDEGGSKGRTSRHEVLFEIDLGVAVADEFFQSEDHLVFGWDRVEHYQREQLRFLFPLIDECQPVLDAYDAGYRVTWDETTKLWSLIQPDGVVLDTYNNRGDAWSDAAQSVAAAAVAVAFDVTDEDVTDDLVETFKGRVDVLRAKLDIDDSDWDDLSFSEQLDQIEDELGLTDHSPPQIDRLSRAEKAAGL